jgi:hypothetical protein
MFSASNGASLGNFRSIVTDICPKQFI